MKMLKMTVVSGLLLMLFLSLSTLSAAAQGPIAYLDNASHSLDANASALYRFDYALTDVGDRPITTITMENATNSGLGFEVWSADNLNDMANNAPIGRGTAATVDCTTGVLSASGACQSPHLTWSGAFGSGGAYFVRVTNNTNTPANYTLRITGSGVSLGQMMAAAPSAPAAAPPLVAANPDDPNRAARIDGQTATAPMDSATWHSFDYAVNNDTGEHPVVTLRLVNGNRSGVEFQVWTPESMTGGWFNNTPIGRGTAQTVDCDTGVLTGSGACQSADLIWSGAFGTSGTYFVRILNNTDADVDYMLTIE
jgi:hypothetical protein